MVQQQIRVFLHTYNVTLTTFHPHQLVITSYSIHYTKLYEAILQTMYPWLASSSIRGYRGIDRDVTDRMQTAELLRKNAAELKAILETSTEWIWEIDLSGHHIYSNDRVRDFLGYSSDECIGKKYSEFV